METEPILFLNATEGDDEGGDENGDNGGDDAADESEGGDAD